MTVRIYLRRSKNDEGKQQFSLDVQRAGGREFIRERQLGARIVEYTDDGKSGDDFHSRTGLRRLIADVKTGDVVVCRDQSRLGRDAIEVTLVIRDLVRDRGCRLYYYSSGQEVQFSNAIDQATTFIQGTGHQMELEAIRSRTREALRARVRAGRVAGGRCYGYALERKRDDSGRSFTIAVVDPLQAEILRRIFQEYREHRGLKAIAIGLNNDGVPPPSAGRRGTGSWSPGALRAMLINPRYRGLYVHGKVKKVRRNGCVERVKADPTDVITVEIPEWQIIDDETWSIVQERFAARVECRGPSGRGGNSTARYALSGIARCGSCGGPVAVQHSSHGKERFRAYGCSWHNHRGSKVCPVTTFQRTEEVEGALVDALQESVLIPDVLDRVLGELRREIEAQMPKAAREVAELEAELHDVRAEQKRLAKAVALTDDVPELAAELQRRAARARVLDAQIATARRTPGEVATLVAKVEREARAKVANLRAALTRPEDLRQVFKAMFPAGVRLQPDRVGKRNVWRIEATADLSEVGGAFSTLNSDPKGT